MSGSEGFAIYTINGGKLEETKNLFALYDVDTEEYTYLADESPITDQEYSDTISDSISAYNPYFALDTDGINETNITINDGFTSYDVVATQKYFSFDEIKEMLEKSGAQIAE